MADNPFDPLTTNPDGTSEAKEEKKDESKQDTEIIAEIELNKQELKAIETKLDLQDEDLEEAQDQRTINTKKISDIERKLEDTMTKMDDISDKLIAIQTQTLSDQEIETLKQLDWDEFRPFVDNTISRDEDDFILKAYKSFVQKSDKKLPTIYNQYRSIKQFGEEVEKERVMDTRRNFLYNLIYHKYEYDLNNIQTANIFMNYYLAPKDNTLMAQTFVAAVQLSFVAALAAGIRESFEDGDDGEPGDIEAILGGDNRGRNIGFGVLIMYLTSFLIFPSIEDIVNDTKTIEKYFHINHYNIVLNSISNILISIFVPLITFFVILASESWGDIVLNATAIAFIIDLDDDSTSEVDMDQWFTEKVRYFPGWFQTIVPFNDEVLNDDVSDERIQAVIEEMIMQIKDENAETKSGKISQEIYQNIKNFLWICILPIATIVYPFVVIVQMIIHRAKADKEARERKAKYQVLPNTDDAPDQAGGQDGYGEITDNDGPNGRQRLLSTEAESKDDKSRNLTISMSPREASAALDGTQTGIGETNDEINYVSIIDLNKEGNKFMYEDDLVNGKNKYHDAIEEIKKRTELLERNAETFYKMKAMLYYNRGLAYKRLGDKANLSELVTNEFGRMRENYKRSEKDLMRSALIFLQLNHNDELKSVSKTMATFMEHARNADEMHKTSDDAMYEFAKTYNEFKDDKNGGKYREIRAQLCINLGDIFYNLHDYACANECYKYAKKIDSNTRIPRDKSDTIDKQLDLISQSNKDKSRLYYANEHFDKALDRFRKKEYGLAIESIRKAIDYDGKDARFYFFKAEIYDFWSMQSSSEYLFDYVKTKVIDAWKSIKDLPEYKTLKEQSIEMEKVIKTTSEYNELNTDEEKATFLQENQLKLKDIKITIDDYEEYFRENLKFMTELKQKGGYKKASGDQQKQFQFLMRQMNKAGKWNKSGMKPHPTKNWYAKKTGIILPPPFILLNKTYKHVDYIIKKINEIDDHSWKEYKKEWLNEGHSWNNIDQLDGEYFLEFVFKKIKQLMTVSDEESNNDMFPKRWRLSEEFYNELLEQQKNVQAIDNDDDPTNDSLQELRHKEAVKNVKKAFKIDRAYAVGFYWVNVESKIIKGELKLAIDRYTADIEFDPKEDFNYFLRSILQIKLENYNDAIHDLKKACELDPRNPFFWLTLGDAQFVSKDYDEETALNTLKKGLDLSGDVGTKELNGIRQHIMNCFWKSSHINFNTQRWGKNQITLELQGFKKFLSLTNDYERELMNIDLGDIDISTVFKPKTDQKDDDEKKDDDIHQKCIDLFLKIGAVEFEGNYYVTRQKFEAYTENRINNSIISYRRIIDALRNRDRRQKYFDPQSSGEIDIKNGLIIDNDKYIARNLAVIIRQNYRWIHNRWINRNNLENKEPRIQLNDRLTEERLGAFYGRLTTHLKKYWNFFEKGKSTYKDLKPLMDFCNKFVKDDGNIKGNSRDRKPFVRLVFYLLNEYDIIDYYEVNKGSKDDNINAMFKEIRPDEDNDGDNNTGNNITIKKLPIQQKKKTHHLPYVMKKTNTMIWT